ncbi:MAG: hypothetical protein GY699_10610 [Desulfobacteraceae bacterium]|nr:hypothetical protein [Desulfobacteraceae bacterium]
MKDLKKKYIETMVSGIPDDLSELKDELSIFYTYPQVQTWDVKWENENNEFLKEIGIPESAPTMLNFKKVPEVDKGFIVIGFNNYGDRILILKESGNLVFENHDFNNRIEYLNKDVISFFKTVCAFADLMKGDQSFSEKMSDIDPDAFRNDTWWHREYLETIKTEQSD